MATKIRLKRMGKKFYAVYRVVIMDSRNKRDGKAIEEIGLYNPNTQPSTIEIDSERAQYWLGVGAQPTDQVRNLLKITGDWQKFKGLKGAEGTLKTVAAKPDAATLIEEADTKAQKL
ncbi:MAG: 30S ribosomal protein S16, partial [Bifidobacterium criceti]|nr:30S ribosomal protein S16 [Bifidobacterium criceti]